MKLKRIALGIQYNGSTFYGWQLQPQFITVQYVVENAIAKFTGVHISTTVAGRTDTGVHALGQVVHFDTSLNRSNFSWIRGINSYLPDSISIQWAIEVPQIFHSRFSAKMRIYDYILQVSPIRPAILAKRIGWVHTPLFIEDMRIASRYLIGTHDFSAFRSSECKAYSAIKTISHIEIVSKGNFIKFRFCAISFLQHMIRNFVGCLIMVGRKRFNPQWIIDIIAAKNRNLAAPTFMPDGLYLSEILYPSIFNLPKSDLSALPMQ